ncbi:MAG TPA: GDSL-type esterase/lipase family protein [Sphingomonadaceae bacterium]|jgi:hypothetical protein|nr:GDSL-type esterase/lipase family protein [Sphingomonadaceae bacterium]
MTIWVKLLDRTAVLFLGVAVGVAMGLAFAGGEEEEAPLPVPATQSSAPAPASSASPSSTRRPAQGQPRLADNRPVTPGLGQSSDPGLDLAAPFGPHLLSTVAQGGKVRVGVFGDSYGDGIWSALYHLLPAKRQYEVVKFSQQSTGFTRYGSLNLEDHLREQIADKPIDIAVISFGANDTQGVMAGRHAAKLLSPEWQAIVGKRVEGFIRILRQQGAMVYWVGLPRMRKPSYDADIAGMNLFYARKMKELGVPWIDTAPLSVDADGNYAPYLPDGPDQKRILIRANDGIHMSMIGYQRITRGLAKRIDHYVDAARRQAGVTPLSGTASARTDETGTGMRAS